MIQLQLHGKPVPWSASEKGRYCFYDPKGKEKEYARWQIKAQYRDRPIGGHVALDFIFFIPIPKGTSKAKRAQMLDGRILPTSPDTTNMQKLYEDCLQGIVIENDRFTNRVTSQRKYAEEPGVLIQVRRWEEVNATYKFEQERDYAVSER